jgi:hypothetical protein
MELAHLEEGTLGVLDLEGLDLGHRVEGHVAVRTAHLHKPISAMRALLALLGARSPPSTSSSMSPRHASITLWFQRLTCVSPR